jgi:hypothetical protein
MASALVCMTLPKMTWPMLLGGDAALRDGGLGGVHDREIVGGERP